MPVVQTSMEFIVCITFLNFFTDLFMKIMNMRCECRCRLEYSIMNSSRELNLVSNICQKGFSKIACELYSLLDIKVSRRLGYWINYLHDLYQKGLLGISLYVVAYLLL